MTNGNRWRGLAAGGAAALLALAACGGGTSEAGRGDGIVRAVDPVTNRVTLDHGDVAGMMKAMKMEFDVAEPSLLSGLAPGDEVRFKLRDDGGGRYTIVEMEEMQEEAQ
jgi:Cu/Ag efflux protein CusF